MSTRLWGSWIALILGLLITGGISAQEAEPSGVSEQEAQEETEAEVEAAPEVTAAPRRIEEMIVTAERRAVNIQDIAISLTAFSGEQMQDLRLDDITTVGKLVPNVLSNATFAGTNPVVAIRGVGLATQFSNNASSVGVYADEVFLTHLGFLNFASFDMERLEVLKGPQGTLYGRNTNGGAFSYYSRKPNHDERDGYLEVTGGNYQYADIEGAVGGPLSDHWAGRVSFKGTYQGESFWDNQVGEEFGDSQQVTLRGQLSGRSPQEKTRFNLSLTYNNSDLAYTPYQAWGVLVPGDGISNIGMWCPGVLENNFPDLDGSCVTVTNEVISNTNPFHGYHQNGTVDRTDQQGFLAIARFDFDLTDTMTLTSVTGYSDLDKDWSDSIPSPAGYNYFVGRHFESFSFFSQELRLAGQNDLLDWIVGGFYSTDNAQGVFPLSLRDLPVLFGLDADNRYDQDISVYALFAHTDWELSDRWSLIAGIRYNVDEVKYVGGSDLVLHDTGDVIPVAGGTEREGEYDSWTGRVAVEFRPTDDWLLYASYSRGFKSPVVLTDVVFDPDEVGLVEPEEVDAYEIGFKSTLANGQLLFNGAAFYYDYTGLQSIAQQQGYIGLRFINAGEARNSGAELEFTWAPTAAFQISGGVGWLDTEIVDDLQTGALNGNPLPMAP
ncbi:MAG: TonB-dependent receptor, partial [Rhodothermales bacterium]|nr:TonB-dependent receptor [Rhodothermales bacterium]